MGFNSGFKGLIRIVASSAVTSLKEKDRTCNCCYTIYTGVHMTTVELHGGISLKYAVFRHRIVW